MKRVDRKRLKRDQELDTLMSSESGRQTYWYMLRERCNNNLLINMLTATLHLPGDVIECGVFRGATLKMMCRILKDQTPTKAIFACDSYEGFPQDKVGPVDLGLLRFMFKIKRKFRYANDVPARLRTFFQTYGINGHIVQGYFSETLQKFHDHPFCFIHLDCDLYQSHQECLRHLYQNLVPGGIVVFDDYDEPKWPGASLAVDEFFSSKTEKVTYQDERGSRVWYVQKPGDLVPASHKLHNMPTHMS